MKIDSDKFEAAYEIAVTVFKGELRLTEGARLLHSQHGLNVNSAKDFIGNYKEMRAGKVFKRAMSAPAMRFFLTRTEEDFGKEVLGTVLQALRKHITYYEQSSGSHSKAMRAVATSFEANLDMPYDLSEHTKAFHKKVSDSIADSSSQRKERLATARTVPLKQRAVVTVYSRNPDVVAEVLIRADGMCERCQKPAPFLRRKDNSPYLEVHHIELIALGGADTVENALALCPNCHRESHYGC